MACEIRPEGSRKSTRDFRLVLLSDDGDCAMYHSRNYGVLVPIWYIVFIFS